jgi:CRP/FNR family cyclic AMP-dependent transcriptional regulator
MEPELMLATIEKVLLLQGVEIFRDTETENLARIAAIAREVRFEEGVTIFKEGEPGDAFYIVVEGAVSMRKGSQEVLLVKDKEPFGWGGLLEDRSRPLTAVALTGTSTLKIEREDLFDLLADHFDIVRGILKRLTRMVSQQLER